MSERIKIKFTEPVVCPTCSSDDYAMTLRGGFGNPHHGNAHTCQACGQSWEYESPTATGDVFNW